MADPIPRAFPAGAGMNRPISKTWANRPSVPRRRGDEPGQAKETVGAGTAFPAGAGMNRLGANCYIRAHGVPRRRGDEPIFYSDDALPEERSPQARG